MTTEKAAARVVEATTHSDFAAAEEAANRYTELVLARLTETPRAEAIRHLEDACALLEWSRRNLCAARARVAGELRRLDLIGQYHQSLALGERVFDGNATSGRG